jgi:chromosome segregation ATPase
MPVLLREHRTVVHEKDTTISTLSQTIDDLNQQLQSSAEESSAVFDLLRELAKIYTPDPDPASSTVDRKTHVLASVREQVEQAGVAKLMINDLTRQLEELTASDADGRVEMELVGAKVRVLEEDVLALQGHLEVSRLELEESRRGAEESATCVLHFPSYDLR